jgi:translation initiation factor IF-2
VDEEDPDSLSVRPPVVTILGHVDHGKTTLLDSIRKSNVVAGEAGGITQHIGAYQVDHSGSKVTFLDTPGHEAFTAMRARGAQVTDVAVLVVAADDGIMPQTVEAMDHIKAAGVPQIVAINKIDRPDADPERVKRQLSEHDILIEEWGGDVISVPVSALKGEGIDDLLDNIMLLSEIGELKADPDREAKGVVVEARLDRSKGAVATLLVQTGTLSVGQIVVAGGISGRVKAMMDDSGARIEQAKPSQPVEILGLNGLPEAGETFVVVASERAARDLVDRYERAQASKKTGISLQDFRSRLESGEAQALDLIIKTDMQGTMEPVRGAVEQLSSGQARVNIIHHASGAITESDVLLAMASDATIVGFNSQPSPGAQSLAAQESVEIRLYDIIYELVEDIDKALKGMLAPVERDVVEGRATVRAVFPVGRRARAAGVTVNEGSISRNGYVHVLRGSRQVHAGAIVSLRRFKDDVREINSGFEGGVVLEGFQDYEEGDVLESHQTVVE